MKKTIIIIAIAILIIYLLKKFVLDNKPIVNQSRLNRQEGIAEAGEDLTNSYNLNLPSNDSSNTETEEEKKKRLGDKLKNILRRKR